MILSRSAGQNTDSLAGLLFFTDIALALRGSPCRQRRRETQHTCYAEGCSIVWRGGTVGVVPSARTGMSMSGPVTLSTCAQALSVQAKPQHEMTQPPLYLRGLPRALFVWGVAVVARPRQSFMWSDARLTT